MKLSNKIVNIMSHLISHGYKAYVVGGAVRDYYMRIKPHDYDIFTNATGDELKELFPDSKVLGGEERQEKILTVIQDGVEVSSFRKNGDRTKIGISLEQHQATCDFTINSLAVDIDGRLCGDKQINKQGLNDIKTKSLHFVGNAEDRIKEDPLRILRGIRFFLKYDLYIDDNTHVELVQTKRILLLPKERIRDELTKILSLDLEQGFLKFIINFLPKEIFDDNMYKLGGDHHDETPYIHSENAFLIACKITDNTLIRLSALLHDIGKAITRTEEDEVIHFYRHEYIGAEIVEKWMNEYKFSKKEIKYVTTMIKFHMFSYKLNPSKKLYIKFFNKLDEAGITIEDYIMLIYSDHQGNMAKKRIKFGDFIKGNFLYQKYWELKYTKEPFTIKDLAISGKDLIEKYNMKPSSRISDVLNLIFNTIMDGDLENKRDKIFYFLNKKRRINNDFGFV